jgi:hypothetical protein
MLAVLLSISVATIGFTFLLGLIAFIGVSFDEKTEIKSDRGISIVDSKPKSQTTFLDPILIDSAKQLYVYKISVSKKEDEDAFFNLLLFDAINKTSVRLLDKPFAGTGLSNFVAGGETLLIFEGSENDSDKDGEILENDLKNFYIYRVEKRQLKKISLPNAGFVSAELLEDGKDFIMRFIEDRNKDGKADSFEERVLAYWYDFEQQKLSPIASPSLLKEIQDLQPKKVEY